MFRSSQRRKDKERVSKKMCFDKFPSFLIMQKRRECGVFHVSLAFRRYDVTRAFLVLPVVS